MRKITGKITAALLLIMVSASAAFCWDAQKEIRRLNKDVPSFDSFRNPSAIIWHKSHKITAAEDGAVDIERHTIVNFGERIPANWNVFRAIIPDKGSLEITEAALYNPMTASLEAKLPVQTETLSGGAQVKLCPIPSAARGRVLVISEKEHRVSGGLDDTILMAEPLPVWEQTVSVRAPQAQPISWYSNQMNEPEVHNDGKLKEYSWKIVNQPAWYGSGLVVYQRPCLSFSKAKTLVDSLALIEDKADKLPEVEMPRESDGSAMDGRQLMKWMDAPERFLAGVPTNWIRSAGLFPKNGPWTAAEQTLILYKWLKKLGWNVNLYWQSKTELKANSTPATDFWSLPVIEVMGGKKARYYQTHQGAAYGEVSPNISGAIIYRTDEKKAEKFAEKTVMAGDPSNHKIYMQWNLSLDEKGVAVGRMSALIEGAWTGIFSGGLVPKASEAEPLIIRNINISIPGLVLTPTAVTATAEGYKLDFDARCTPGIVYGNDMLVRLPAGVPNILGQLISEDENYTFRFPYIIEQKVRMTTPRGYRLLQPKRTLHSGRRKIMVFDEKVEHNPIRGILEADSRWLVKKLRIEYDDAELMKQQLGQLLRWPSLNLPFRK